MLKKAEIVGWAGLARWAGLVAIAGALLGCDAVSEKLGVGQEAARAETSEADEAESEAPKKKKKKKKKKDAAEAPSDANTAAQVQVPAIPDPLAGAALTPPVPAAPPVDYFVDASEIPRLYKAQVTPTKLLELVIYPTYANAQILDPAKPTEANEYRLRGSVVGPSEPVRFIGKVPTKEGLERISFGVDEFNAALVPTLAKDALTRLAYENGKVSHIIVKRFLPFSSDLRFRVYAKTDRLSGSVEYDKAGKMTRVYQ